MRRRSLVTAAGLLMAGALTLNAHTPQAPAPQQKAAPAGNQTIAITGCLEEDKDAAGGEGFVLTNVKMAPGGTASAVGLASTYEVEGLAAVELQKHLNHQVELAGRPGARAAQPSTPPAGGAASVTLPQFEATSLKMVAATCSAK